MRSTPFGQVLTAMITPFDEQGNVDRAGVAGIVEHLLANGSDGIVVAGTTGESPTLSHDEKLDLFKLVKEIVGSRGKVVAGTGSNDTSASVDLTREAAAIGVDGALLVVPSYNRPSQEGMYRHFRLIAESVPHLACMLYNVPSRTAQNLDAPTTLRLANDVKNIVATKEASGNLTQCSEILAKAPKDFAVYSGDDGLTLPLLAIGGCGVVSVVSHIVGTDMKAMHTAFFSGDFEEASRLHLKMQSAIKACFQATTPSPAPLKAALRMMKLPAGPLRMPLIEVTDNEERIVQQMLSEYGLI